MAWRIGKCDRCNEPRGDNYACMFRVRALVWRWFWRVRMWRWWCDECCIERQQERRERIKAKGPSHE